MTHTEAYRKLRQSRKLVESVRTGYQGTDTTDLAFYALVNLTLHALVSLAALVDTARAVGK